MLGDGRGRAFQGCSSACETHLLALTQGGAAAVTCGGSLWDRVSLPAHPACGGSAGELVAEPRAGEKWLCFFRGQAGEVCWACSRQHSGRGELMGALGLCLGTWKKSWWSLELFSSLLQLQEKQVSEWGRSVPPVSEPHCTSAGTVPSHLGIPASLWASWQTELTELDLGILNLADEAKWFLLFLIHIHTKFLQFYFPLPSSLKGEAIAFLEVAYDFSRQKLFPFQGYWQYPNICPGIGQSQGAWFRAAASNV